MAQNFTNAVLTDAGAALLAKAQAGLATINFTKIATGDGVYTDKSVDALKVKTALVSQRQEFSLNSKEVYNQTAARVTTVITNRYLSDGYYMNEIGLFAQDGNDEILYSIAVTEGTQGDWMPPYNGHSPAEIIQSFVVTVDNSLNVTIELGSDSYALAQDLSDHMGEAARSSSGAHGLRYYNEKLEAYNATTEQWDEIETGGASSIVTVKTDNSSLFGQAVTLSQDALSFSSTFSDGTGGVAIAQISVKYTGTYTVTSEGEALGKVKVTELGGAYVLDDTTKIYGFHINGTESNPASMISYAVQYDGQNVRNYNYTPAAVNLSTGVMNPGDWNLEDDFFIPRSCMVKYDGTVDYYLDEDDETKKEDGTASDVANTAYEGNAMMEWGRNGKRIYMKIVPDSTDTAGATVYIANKRVDTGFTDYPFYDANGVEIDHFYTAKYNGSLVSGKLRSLSGQTPCNSQTGSAEINYATANNVNAGTEWYIETTGDRQLINMLLIMISKTTNSQAAFGQGYTTGGSAASSLAASGTLNGKGQWYGSTVNNSKTNGVKVFGMEHWWGNIWRRTAGHLNMSGTQKIKLTFSTVDGSTQTGYDATGSGYITLQNATPGGTSGGYTNVMIFTTKGMYAKTASGSESTYYTDGLWFSNSQANFALCGGACNDGSRCGALCVDLDVAVSAASWSIGAALSYKPLAA